MRRRDQQSPAVPERDEDGVRVAAVAEVRETVTEGAVGEVTERQQQESAIRRPRAPAASAAPLEVGEVQEEIVRVVPVCFRIAEDLTAEEAQRGGGHAGRRTGRKTQVPEVVELERKKGTDNGLLGEGEAMVGASGRGARHVK
jgi:hypothetical protein